MGDAIMDCKECKCPILVHMKYCKHNDGTVLCKDCFDKFVEHDGKEQCSRCGKWFKLLYNCFGFRLCTYCCDKARKELGKRRGKK